MKFHQTPSATKSGKKRRHLQIRQSWKRRIKRRKALSKKSSSPSSPA